MKNHQKTDEVLLREYLDGSEAALEVLIHRHQRKVFTAIYMLVKDRMLAEDLFQETFIKVVDRLRKGNYRESGHFLPWVLRIAHNLCIDYFRKTKSQAKVVCSRGDDIFKWMKFEEVAMEDFSVRQEVEKDLKALMEFLPVEQKEVLYLRIFLKFSFKEVAAFTHSNMNTCLGRMRYALINLRKLAEHHKLEARLCN